MKIELSIIDVRQAIAVAGVLKAASVSVRFDGAQLEISAHTESGKSNTMVTPTKVVDPTPAEFVLGLPNLSNATAALSRQGDEVTWALTGDGRLQVKAKRSKLHIWLIEASPIRVERPDISTFTPGNGLKQIREIEWATGSISSPPFHGVMVDGERAWATNREVLSTCACELELDRQLVLDMTLIKPIISKAETVWMRSMEGSPIFELIVDATYVALPTIIAGAYPKVDQFLTTTPPISVELNRKELVDICVDAKLISGHENPRLKVEVTGQALNLSCVGPDGELEDSIDAVGSSSEPFQFEMSLERLSTAIRTLSADRITWRMGPHPFKSPTTLTGDDDDAFIFMMPRKPK